jgi:hypothetical protein
MERIMKKEAFLRRILYLGVILVILTIVLMPLIIIPFVFADKTGTATPGPATVGTIILVILHLLILYGFREAIIVNKRNGHLNTAVFIICGIALLLFGLIILDGATEFLGFYHNYLLGITLLFCIGCDVVAAIIAFTAIFLQPGKK